MLLLITLGQWSQELPKMGNPIKWWFSLTAASLYGLFKSENIFCVLREVVLIPSFFSFFFFNTVTKQLSWGLF